MSDWFSVPYGILRDGKPLLAAVVLSQPLKRGHLRIIAHQILAIAEMAEETIEEAPDHMAQEMLLGVPATAAPTAPAGGQEEG